MLLTLRARWQGMNSYAYGPASDEECAAVLNHAIDIGCTFWDTADVYANETLLGEVLKKRRDEVFICTKFGIVRDPHNKAFLGMDLPVCGTPEYVRMCCDESLKRLGVETIDLYYQHRVDRNTPIEETVRAMAELVKENKVRYLGLSECSAETLRRACKVHPIAAVEVEYSPWSLDVEENGLLAAARELGVAIVAYAPLGRGFLTGTIKSFDDLDPSDSRRRWPRYAPENFANNLVLVDKIKELAAKKGCSPSQFVLAWVLAQGDDFIVIPGTKHIKYLDENRGALDVTINEDDKSAMRAAITGTTVRGERYAAAQLAHVSI